MSSGWNRHCKLKIKSRSFCIFSIYTINRANTFWICFINIFENFSVHCKSAIKAYDINLAKHQHFFIVFLIEQSFNTSEEGSRNLSFLFYYLTLNPFIANKKDGIAKNLKIKYPLPLPTLLANHTGNQVNHISNKQHVEFLWSCKLTHVMD